MGVKEVSVIASAAKQSLKSFFMELQFSSGPNSCSGLLVMKTDKDEGDMYTVT